MSRSEHDRVYVVWLLGLLLLVATVLIITNVVNAAPGDLDTSFGTGGVVTTDILGDDFARDVALQSDGKIVVAGWSVNGGDRDFILVRYNIDGSIDTSFGTNGIVTTDVGNSNDFGNAITIQSDGKILLAGYSDNGNDNDIVVLRYNDAGNLDSGFGSNGVVTTDIGGNADYATAIALQEDGKIIVAGNSSDGNPDILVIRYQSNGALDTSFGVDGIALTDISGNDDFGNDIALQANGKVVVAGTTRAGSDFSSPSDFAVVRYNSDGTLDGNFDSDGIVTTSTPNGSGPSRAEALALSPNGKIVVAGAFWNGMPGSGHAEIGTVRYNSDGSLDTSFNGDGVLTTSINAYGGAADVALQANDKIVVAGTTGLSFGGDVLYVTVRYDIDGSLDSSFGANGVVTTEVGDGRDTARGLVIQADGKIVVTGYSDIGAENDVVLLRYYGDTIEVNEPELLTNYHTGAPGSYFTLAAQGFPANSVGTLSVNGHTVGTVSIDANGETTFTLSTMNATAGIYTTTLSVNPEASMSLMIDPNAPLRDREDFDSPIFEIPVGSTADYEVYLPSIAKE